jgi:energy-coupling factor transporter ATP-binding protein EcfA2
MPEVAIRTEGLSYTYQGSNTAALKGIDLSISHGETASILGRNGSGKTTLVRHFNGLSPGRTMTEMPGP